MTFTERMTSWAQNEEMVDAGYTEHGKDCLSAVALVAALRALVEAEEAYGDGSNVAVNEAWGPAKALLRELGGSD